MILKLLSWLFLVMSSPSLSLLLPAFPAFGSHSATLSIQEKVISGLITLQQSHLHLVDRSRNLLPTNLNCVLHQLFRRTKKIIAEAYNPPNERRRGEQNCGVGGPMGEPVPVFQQICQRFLCAGGWGSSDRMLINWGHRQMQK